MPDPSEALQAEILAEIRSRGPMPFDRFMDLALYHPRHGYYSRGLGGGGGRDYVTSSTLHSLFGAMIARQAAEMWRLIGSPDPFLFVEFGPGEGIFAADFLRAAPAEFARALRYRLVERSPTLRLRQQERLAGSPPQSVDWWTIEQFTRQPPFAGCLFANEVLDAFPVRRLLGSAEGLREIHVGEDDGRLREVVLPPFDDEAARFLTDCGVTLENGQEADVNLEAPSFLAAALRRLRFGYAIVVDYGDETKRLYHPVRWSGTLRAFHRHRVHEDVLSRPGDQDLTAHVDFGALARAASEAGARVLGRVGQGRFLLSLGALDHLDTVDDQAAPRRAEGAAARLERIREREALKELILPDRMGETFQVMVLGTREAPASLSGLKDPWDRPAPLERMERCQ